MGAGQGTKVGVSWVAAHKGGGRAMAARQASASREAATDTPSPPARLGMVQLGTLPWLDPACGGCTEQPKMCCFVMEVGARHPLRQRKCRAPGRGRCMGVAPTASAAPISPTLNFTFPHTTQPVTTSHGQLGYLLPGQLHILCKLCVPRAASSPRQAGSALLSPSQPACSLGRHVHRITELQNHFPWKRPLRSLGPTIT